MDGGTMLIPSSQEFDPGKGDIQTSELKALRVARINGMLDHEQASQVQSHGYLFTLDLPRIHRILRPIKAKIAAINLAIKSAPSFGYAPINSVATRDEPVGDFPEDSYDIASRNVKNQYGQSRSLRIRQNGHQNYRNPRQKLTADLSSRQMDSSRSAAISGSGTHSGSDVLVRRFRASLMDQFKDAIEKVWWHPFCEDYNLPLNSTPASIVDAGLVPNSFTLGISCAFAVGRIVAHLKEDDTVQLERHYNIMPAHMRRFALLENIVEMCLTQIPIGHLIAPLAEVCARYRADSQALRLLEHLSFVHDKTFQMDYQWAYKIALEVNQGDVWVAMISGNSPSTFFTTGVFQLFLRQIQPQHRANLIRTSFDVYMDKSLSYISGRARRSRAIHWTCLLVEDSLKLYEKATGSTENRQDTVLGQCNKVIEYMARCLFNISSNSECTARAESQMGLKDVALALALHSLYIAVTIPSESMGDESVQGWVQLLETHMTYDLRQMDLDVVVRSYGTLTNLNALALMLDAVGLYALSMKLINRMLEDFYTLDKNTRRQLGYVCDVTVSSLESQLREVEQRRIQHASSDLWRYDDLLEDWIERTPKANKTALIMLSDDKSDCGYSDDNASQRIEDREDFSPSTPPSRSARIFNFDTYHSTVTYPPSKGQPLPAMERSSKQQQRRALETSPFIIRKAVRYSMTPIRRPVRSTRQQIHYNDSVSELDELEEEEKEEEGGEEAAHDIVRINPLATYNDQHSEEEEEGDRGLETRFGASLRPLYIDEDYVHNGLDSGDSGQESLDEPDTRIPQDADSEHSAEDAPEVIVLSDSSDDSSRPYENYGSSNEQDSHICSGAESGQERLQDYNGDTGVRTWSSSNDDSDYIDPRSVSRKKLQGAVLGKQTAALNRSKYDDSTGLYSNKSFIATSEVSEVESGDEKRQGAAYYDRQPDRRYNARLYKQPANISQSDSEPESDGDFQPSRKSRNIIEKPTRLRRRIPRRAVSQEFSRQVLPHRGRSITTTLKTNKWIYGDIAEDIADNSADGEDESPDSEHIYNSATPPKSGYASNTSRSERDTESSSESDYEEVNAKKRTQSHTYYQTAKRIRRSIVSEDNTLQAEMDFSDEEYDHDRNVSTSKDEESPGEESDVEYDNGEDDTMNFSNRESAFSVGAPLPMTVPDELAFWI
ncbi:hypothetical protein BGX27_000434 [Mortierella sp. AM989]|nr:hypothetical protein BGX27_000434 [Mortierella sp. AM989]